MEYKFFFQISLLENVADVDMSDVRIIIMSDVRIIIMWLNVCG